MSLQSRLVAGILLILVPTVEMGGASILSLLIATQAMPRTTYGRISGGQVTPTLACGWCSLW